MRLDDAFGHLVVTLATSCQLSSFTAAKFAEILLHVDVVVMHFQERAHLVDMYQNDNRVRNKNNL